MKISKVIKCQISENFVDVLDNFVGLLDDEIDALDDFCRECNDSCSEDDFPILMACCGVEIDFSEFRSKMLELRLKVHSFSDLVR